MLIIRIIKMKSQIDKLFNALKRIDMSLLTDEEKELERKKHNANVIRQYKLNKSVKTFNDKVKPVVNNIKELISIDFQTRKLIKRELIN